MKYVLIGFFALVIIAVGVILSVVNWYQRALKPVSTTTTSAKTTFVIQRGESFTEITNDLKTKGFIRSTTAFSYYYRQHGFLGHVQAGKYALSKNMSVAQILNILTHGKVISDSIAVTIPEGYNVTEIATKLASEGICSKQDFLDAEEHADFSQSFLQGLSSRKGIRYRLEGFLFPDTYDFVPKENPVDVINEMLDDFQRRVLTQANESQMKSMHMTLNQLVTEASLVENEAEVDSERPLIASVIDNRLKIGMKLQIDATVEYALGHHVAVVTDQDTKTKSPYNTYMVTGLPPGPIDNPGLKSIDAVLHPAKTNYLYYVAKGDGSGEHYFSHSYSTQLKNEQRRAQNLKKSG